MRLIGPPGGVMISFNWRHNERHGVSNHRRLDCLLNCLFRRSSKKTSKLRITGLCERNPPLTGEFPSQGASNAENVSIWRHHHVKRLQCFRFWFNYLNHHQCKWETNVSRGTTWRVMNWLNLLGPTFGSIPWSKCIKLCIKIINIKSNIYRNGLIYIIVVRVLLGVIR